MATTMLKRTKKITLATIKAFARKNAENLYVRTLSSFDGMTDCVQRTEDLFRKVEAVDFADSSTWGIAGAWFVRGSRDYFDAFEENGYTGYRVGNCCGSFILATKAVEPELTTVQLKFMTKHIQIIDECRYAPGSHVAQRIAAEILPRTMGVR